jgi:beta-lactamase-like protein
VVGMEFSPTGALIYGHGEDGDYAVGILDAFERVLVRTAPSQSTTGDTPVALWPVARRSLLAHLYKLVAGGKVQVSRGGRYRLKT